MSNALSERDMLHSHRSKAKVKYANHLDDSDRELQIERHKADLIAETERMMAAREPELSNRPSLRQLHNN